jgi:hypothetical protein
MGMMRSCLSVYTTILRGSYIVKAVISNQFDLLAAAATTTNGF